MAPNIKDQLPILKQIIQYFKKDGIILDSPLFKLHNQMSCMVIGIGFIFISVENYLDTKAILCHSGQQFHAYAKYVLNVNIYYSVFIGENVPDISFQRELSS